MFMFAQWAMMDKLSFVLGINFLDKMRKRDMIFVDFLDT